MTDCPVCGRAIGTPWLAERDAGNPEKLVITACSQVCLDQAVAHANRTIQDMLEMLKRPIQPQYFYIKPAPECTEGTTVMEMSNSFERVLKVQDPNFVCSFVGDVLHALADSEGTEWLRFCYSIRYKNQKFSLDELKSKNGSGQIFYLVHTCYRAPDGAVAMVATRDVCTPDTLVIQMEELLARINWTRRTKL